MPGLQRRIWRMGPWLVDVHDRSELDPWLGDSPPTLYAPVVMVVRGDTPRLREFLPNALDAAKLHPHRVVLWVKDSTVLDEEEIKTLFLDDTTIVAAVLSTDHTVTSWVYENQLSVANATFAFEKATTT